MGTDIFADTGSSGLLVFAATYAAMLVIPGPSFVIVSQACLSASRRDAALTAAGVAVGAGLLVVLIVTATAGLPASDVSAGVGRLMGALVLLVVGLRALGRALRPNGSIPPSDGKSRRGRHFGIGLVTALTNPISFSFFSGAVLASGTARSGLSGALVPATVFLMALAWFGFVALLLSHPAMKHLYGRAARRLDGVTGAVLVLMSLTWLDGPG